MNKKSILTMVRDLSKARLSRTTLYLNIDRVKDQYFQNGGLDIIEESEGLNSEITGGIQALIASVGSHVSNTGGSIGQLKINPLLMAILLEEDKKRNSLLLDPAIIDILPQGALLKHVADTQLVRPSQIVSTETSGLPEEIARIVQAERESQMADQDDLGHPIKTVVWATSNGKCLASIVSAEFVNPNSFSSYRTGLLGILGLLEKDTPSVRFIAPIWIWHEGFRGSVEAA